jgi:hypothetical protein
MIQRLSIACVLASLCVIPAVGQEFQNPKANIAPKAAPQRVNAGEGFPPLPLPATPLRRSEPKREPAPPAVIGSITFSPLAAQKAGITWQTTIIDVEKWVAFTNNQLAQRYRFVNTDFGKFSYDPAELPILYFTGWQALPQFDDETAERLRTYLLNGGTWVVHSNCGRPEFNNSFRREIARILPQRELAPIPTDHPLFSAFYKITQMQVRKGSEPWQKVPPYLEVVNIGTRAAVIFSPIDLSCGWDANANPIEGGVLYAQDDALKLGSNIMTYCLAEYQYGRFFANQKIYHQAADATRDQLVLGQIVHNGDWDPTPHGLPNLLKHIDQETTLRVQFKRVAVDVEKGDIFSFPVLYMTGQRHFAFSDAARKRLRQYLDNGGVLLCDCAVGASEFRDAFRKEMGLIYPGKTLAPLPATHPLLRFRYDTRQVKLAPLARAALGEAIAPRLEVIEADGLLPVIFSPLSLSAGWEQLPRAYNMGYADEDALRVGVNLLLYVVAH